MTDNRTSLSETSINGLRSVYNGVKYFGSGSAHKHQLDEEKKLLNRQKELDKKMKEAAYLLEEGTNRLNKGLKSGVLLEIYATKLLIMGDREKFTLNNEKR
ncbi:unnamed protein product [Adineta steineri]|uniref:Uncharacterized protein n=1 Tax=Adineta steineri TaxID=433720 RepID=A0A819XLH2_9BILA|nr:unnamed protein product [Adineta steineri]CAF4143642.1 unnamed protein product [Adineta steineri]